ncbi:FAD-binding and (Fe-S)-binding domain-containing protein [Mycetocola sp. 2940]|uniref:FAD-binding and (Fe-S)-binding domain-containing protein n=1 Tax=Mycetocola sp. 2940 TaxID=3156452 RepID=UPI00339B18D4
MTDPATAVADALRSAIDGEVSISTSRRAQYSSDASNYRVPPSVVAFPRTTDELAAITDVSRAHGMPLTLRGAGTSVAGNAIGSGIVVDTSRHLNRILEIDADSRTALVEPGVVLSALNSAAAPHGLRFGPDPSTHARATVGGLIGNNACGAHALAYGRTADNVVSLEVIDGTGRRYEAAQDLSVVPGLRSLVDDELEILRLEFGRFGRQVSGYSLEHLLPENGTRLARALVGTEGTVATILQARVRLVQVPVAPALVVLGYPDMATAADAVPALLAHRPLAIEGLDARLVDVIRRHKGASRVPELPAGGGWLLVEVGGESAAEALYAAGLLVQDAATTAVRVLPAGPEAAALWRIREDGAGLAGRTAAGTQAWPGWEDAAVSPERLGSYLREFETLMDDYGVSGLPYGHFGDGCIHVRIDIPLERDGSVLRSFMVDAAKLVTSHGGSLSGEHGDGRARGELLSLMYSPEAIALLGRFKALFDPNNLLNPGIIVDPAPLDADLRRPRALPVVRVNGFAFTHDDGDFTKAAHRCVGVGKCRADSGASGGFMCPSYQATMDENDVTRGRARVLQEMINGELVSDGWRSQEVHDALDLCLSCKACSRDCPAGVDMAQYKSEVLYRSFRGRLRPVSHYVLGWLPRWARLAAIAPRLVNVVAGVRPLAKVGLRLGGMDSRREIPAFADRTFRQSRRGVASHDPGCGHQAPHVVLWVDSFSNSFTPGNAGAAIRVLEDAGFHVVVPDEDACCGLTWISTGQLDGARRRLSRLLDVLGPYAEAGIPIVGLEPSCTAVLRSDLVDLFPGNARATAVSGATVTMAEVLATVEGWIPPDLSDVVAVVQPHCHQYSVMGFDFDRALLERAGANITTIAGCCGLAGNFGMEKGHYDTSVAVAEHALLPALRARPEGAIFLADGFSCRTQADQLAGVEGTTLSELLADRIPARQPVA